MSVEITIKQKGFFKKSLPLEVILGNNLKYGAYDGLRLARDETVNYYKLKSIVEKYRVDI